jgi:hypothetical protein
MRLALLLQCSFILDMEWNEESVLLPVRKHPESPVACTVTLLHCGRAMH